jgi:hypothetical protein
VTKINDLLPTSVACRVARIDRQRFNEHVASGAYFFAPSPEKGRSRYFSDEDLVPLYIFARHTERGLNSQKAGQVANMVFEAIRFEGGDEKQIAICYSVNGSIYHVWGSNLPRDAERTLKPTPYEIQIFDLENIRAELAAGIAYERRIVNAFESDEDRQS